MPALPLFSSTVTGRVVSKPLPASTSALNSGVLGAEGVLPPPEEPPLLLVLLKLMEQVAYMKVSYKKLWKLLIDRDVKKKDLQLAAGLSSTTIAKLSNHKNVSMDVLIKVCTLLGVDFL